MDTTFHPDRRDAPRIPSALPVYVNGQQAKLIDLSANGVGFVTESPPRLGHTVQIGMRYLPDDAHPGPSMAEVVRISEEEDGRYSVGAKLLPQPAPTGAG